MSIKKYDRVVPAKYMLLKPKEDDNAVEEYPKWMPIGVHNVSKVRHTGAGTFVRTDRLGRRWVNADWFVPATSLRSVKAAH